MKRKVLSHANGNPSPILESIAFSSLVRPCVAVFCPSYVMCERVRCSDNKGNTNRPEWPPTRSRARGPPTSSFPIKVIAQPISQLNHCEQLASSRRWTAQGASRRRWTKIFDCFDSTNLRISCPGLRDPLSSSQTLQSLPDAGRYLSLSHMSSISLCGRE